ncbi:MAG TPA: PhnD/SsuA/transferrin family substrate-binding protein [Tepidisphaeraceae bacterium]|jgi:phosphonate transport system substrate-binding protein
MSDVTPPTGPESHRQLIPHRRGSGLVGRIILFACLAAALAYVGIAARQVMQGKEAVRQSEEQTVASAGLVTGSAHKVLTAAFTDKQGRLLADPPASETEWLNPDTLVVAHIEGDGTTPGASWAQWEARLAAATGKKVVDQVYTNSPDQVAAISAGKITLLALHAADAPFLVNNHGFQPLAVLGDASGINGHRLDLIVPAGSPIAKPADLRGHRLVCTVPGSVAGYRAAVAFLLRDQGLRPNVDYEVIWSTGMKRSINGIAEKKFEAAAVSDDKLKSMVASGALDASKFKVIYESPVIPRTTIGYFYNLEPALAEQLRKAILAPSPTTAPDELRFIPIDYKADFQFVRDVDDQFDPRFDAKTRHASPAE